jgi:radical SAM family uncharacterized protein
MMKFVSENTPQAIQSKLERNLLRVQKPGRYVGGELNQVNKPWDQVNIHVALVFPDIYDIGVSNLGLMILYDQLNKRSDTLAERAYAPWLDMENIMRQEGILLYSLESKHPLRDFDIIAITLPYETLYTNTLNLLDLAGLPILSSERTEGHPIVIAGGQAAFNPEPMAAFIDAFAIGEGEEIIHEFVSCHQDWKNSSKPRGNLFASLAQIPGIYVPSLYSPRYTPLGTVSEMVRLDDSAPLPIIKRIVPILPPPPEKPLVPSIDIVHNRVAIEIMRGCTRGCRFCHAGMVNRPVRERPVSQVVDAIQTSLDNTGFEEIALLSLSSSDYTRIMELIEMIGERFLGQNLKISLPSLRIESFSIDLLEKMRNSRSGGFTLAPEAATDHMRSIINKPISSDQLIDVARAIFSHGWLSLKLYFMIGQPEESMEDVKAIASLCKAVIAEGRKAIGRRAALNVGVSTFVPKPHTPFQWVSLEQEDQIRAKIDLLRRELKSSGVKFNWNDPKETLLEAWLSRGDRRLAQVIYSAWQRGAKFDAWQDQLNISAWQEAFSDNGLEPAFYTHRKRPIEEILPWDHIHTGVNRHFLEQDYQRAMNGQLTPFCREQCYACGVLTSFSDLRRQNPGDDWKCPELSPTSPL